MSMLSERLRAYRLASRLTFGELAQHTGLSKSYLHQLENNPTLDPALSVIRRLADHYQVSLDSLCDHSAAPDISYPALTQFAEQHALDNDQQCLLASLHLYGQRPSRPIDYWYVWRAIQLACSDH